MGWAGTGTDTHPPPHPHNSFGPRSACRAVAVALSRAQVHPKFLHSNSTSHRWAFGAIAELIDNAMDPDVMATQFQVELRDIRGKRCLVFMDNGFGMVPEQLHKMLGFGHSEKEDRGQHRAIGRYGNGFKSGSMRLGADALVLTKHGGGTQSVGFLSRTFLEDIRAGEVLVPMISYDHSGRRLEEEPEATRESLQAIADYSIFRTEQELLMQFAAIPKTGSIVLITGLKKSGGDYELDFASDSADIQLFPARGGEGEEESARAALHYKYQYSLQAYLAVLYKVPRMQIFLRGKKIKTKRVASSLCEKMVDRYRPRSLDSGQSFCIEMGFNSEGTEECGMMLYHNNRLIVPYQRVGLQLEAGNAKGAGVVGVAECDFLQPTHNKQDFNDTKFYRGLIFKLSQMLKHFWWARVESVPDPLPQRRKRLRAREEASRSGTVVDLIPDDVWVQCDFPDCLKWRKMPEGTDPGSLPAAWYCHMHPNPAIAKASHAYPEEPYEEQEERHERIRQTQESKKAFKDSQASKKIRRVNVTAEQVEKLRVLEELEQETKAHENHLEGERAGLERLQQQLRAQYANMSQAGGPQAVVAGVEAATTAAVAAKSIAKSPPPDRAQPPHASTAHPSPLPNLAVDNGSAQALAQEPTTTAAALETPSTSTKSAPPPQRQSPPQPPVAPSQHPPAEISVPCVEDVKLLVPRRFDWKGGCVTLAKKLHVLMAGLGAEVGSGPPELEALVEADIERAFRRAARGPSPVP